MGNYATQSDLELRFGSINVAKWSQQDSSVDSTTVDATKVALAITHAENKINNRLRSLYQVPLTANSSDALEAAKEWTCVYAAAWLYISRPQGFTTDSASTVEALKLDADDQINSVLAYMTRLDCPMASGGRPMSTAPEVAL